jgi:hypothetical protein
MVLSDSGCAQGFVMFASFHPPERLSFPGAQTGGFGHGSGVGFECPVFRRLPLRRDIAIVDLAVGVLPPVYPGTLRAGGENQDSEYPYEEHSAACEHVDESMNQGLELILDACRSEVCRTTRCRVVG